jgi:hypothetical protein
MELFNCQGLDNALTPAAIAGLAVGLFAALVLLFLALNLCCARASKLRRYYMRVKMQLKGAPKSGRLSLVITDIEGYSGKSSAAVAQTAVLFFGKRKWKA